MNQATAPRKAILDWLTVVAIASIAISLTVGLHESVHALTCVVVGGQLREVSALHAECDSQTPLQRKLVAGAAPLYNLLAGLLLWAVARNALGLTPQGWTFCWLLASMNLFYGAGYFLLSGIAGIGDLAVVVDGWQPAWLWRVGLVLLGAPLYAGCVWLALRTFARRAGGEAEARTRHAQKLGLLSYGTSAGAVALAGLFHPQGPLGLPATAGLMAALGALSPLLYMMRWLGAERFRVGRTPLEIRRRWAWVATAVVVVALYVVVLGRTLYF
jgi:hypothetical protein